MQRILVTGGLGRLGRPLLMALLHRGFQIRALRLPTEIVPEDLAPHIETVTGDIADVASLRHCCDGVQAVLHAAGILEAEHEGDFDRINTGGTQNLLTEAERAGIQHFVLISSISVSYSRLSPYARSKARAEAAVLQSAIAGKTIIRPTLIYDDAGGAAEFARFVRYVARYPLVFLPQGGKALKKPVHVEDAASLLARLMLAPIAYGKTYALAGGESLSLVAMARRIAEGLGLKRWVFPVPAWGAQLGSTLLQGFGPVQGRWRKKTIAVFQGVLGLLQNAAPSTRDLEKDFGYAPRVFSPTRDSLRMAVNPGHRAR